MILFVKVENKNNNVIMTKNGTPNVNILVNTSIGLIKAHTPNIANVLNMFDPKTLPTAISGFPLLAAVIVTKSSGNDVPIAKALVAITDLFNPVISDIFIIDSISQSALKYIKIDVNIK